MSKLKINSKIIQKLQQGGLTVFAPEPNAYRSPVPGVDPSVYKFSPLATFDMSPLVEMQQKQQAIDLQRQNAALAREKMMHQRDLLDRKQAMQNEKEMTAMFFDNHTKSGGQATDAAGSPLYYNDDLSTSARFSPLFKQWEEEKLNTMSELMYIKSLPYDTKGRSEALLKAMQKFQDVSKRMPATAAMQADALQYKKIMESIANPKGDFRVNMPMFNMWQSNRTAYLKNEPGSEKLYQLNMLPPGMFYNYKNGKEGFDAAMLKLNSPQEMEKRLTTSGNMIIEEVDKKVLSTDIAAERLSELVMQNPDLRGYIQDQYGIALYSKAPGDDMSLADKNALIEVLKPLLKYDDDTQTFGVSTEQAFKGQAPSPDSGDDAGGGSSQSQRSNSTAVLDAYRGSYMDQNTGKIDVTQVPTSELGKAAAALTDSTVNFYSGKSMSSSETALKMKLDSVSMAFLRLGGDPGSAEQVDILRKYLDKLIRDEDHIFNDEEEGDLKAELQEIISKQPKPGSQALTPWWASPSSNTQPGMSSTNTSAVDLAKQLNK